MALRDCQVHWLSLQLRQLVDTLSTKSIVYNALGIGCLSNQLSKWRRMMH